MKSVITKSGPGIAQVKQDLSRVRGSDVLVGIPAQKTLRKGQKMNNATLMFIHTHGSPLRNIPARAVLEPAIKADFKLIDPHLKRAAQATIQGKPQVAEQALNMAGIAASNVAKRWFTDPRNGWAPNAPSTIAQKGSDRPMIDTGQLRGAITYVVRQDQVAKTEPAAQSKPGVVKTVAEHVAAEVVDTLLEL